MKCSSLCKGKMNPERKPPLRNKGLIGPYWGKPMITVIGFGGSRLTSNYYNKVLPNGCPLPVFEWSYTYKSYNLSKWPYKWVTVVITYKWGYGGSGAHLVAWHLSDVVGQCAWPSQFAAYLQDAYPAAQLYSYARGRARDCLVVGWGETGCQRVNQPTNHSTNLPTNSTQCSSIFWGGCNLECALTEMAPWHYVFWHVFFGIAKNRTW